MNSKYGGYGSGDYRLVQYLATGDSNVITRTDGAREMIKSISLDNVESYLNNSPYKTYTIMDYIKNQTIK